MTKEEEEVGRGKAGDHSPELGSEARRSWTWMLYQRTRNREALSPEEVGSCGFHMSAEPQAGWTASWLRAASGSQSVGWAQEITLVQSHGVPKKAGHKTH